MGTSGTDQADSARNDSVSRREFKKRVIRERLVAAADRLFDDVGYEAARTSDIAANADVAQATLFRHFPSKAELALYHLRVAVDDMVDEIERRPIDESPFEAVMAVVRGPRFGALASSRVQAECARVGDNSELIAQVHRIVADVKGRLAIAFAQRLAIDQRGPRAVVLANVVADIAIYTIERAIEEQRDPGLTFTESIEELRPLLDLTPVGCVAGPA